MNIFTEFSSFNSTTVRLKELFLYCSYNHQISFNSTTVRLKAELIESYENNRTGFNSTTVRLKDSIRYDGEAYYLVSILRQYD